MECRANNTKSKPTTRKPGYIFKTKICSTLQGEIWQCIQQNTNKKVVIKKTDLNLHQNGIIYLNGQEIKVQENILTEKSILKYLSDDIKCPKSIVKYIDSFKSNRYYYMVEEYGGTRLFDFIVNVHHFISMGRLAISEWHRVCKIIFKQMIECIEYCHSKNVCHFDISLENFLISDIQIDVRKNGNSESITFITDKKDSVQIKLCDFGLAKLFQNDNSGENESKNICFESNKYCGKDNYFSPEITMRKRNFNAKMNDTWCLITCLWCMIVGASPWRYTCENDELFKYIINGNIRQLLCLWNKLEYINNDLIKLFSLVFQYEEKRINIEQIKKCSWLIN